MFSTMYSGISRVYKCILMYISETEIAHVCYEISAADPITSNLWDVWRRQGFSPQERCEGVDCVANEDIMYNITTHLVMCFNPGT